ncbi:hypothetical protein GLOTRDRAFT_125893 [Gloeophyllum trabeum ATCC 11539]|uniref:DUF4187 domain-containing protein n=1 Tax=Gloeophyllum trabeum (strain ATCC 11539 / FP-39264 / Madison 617) TaxID=670483 RepID=S7QIX7_GLOTA|nr:uncharacterized protein GLOTRDRAFT_125893 [Gloeophyllum trabeum ATCC 11539]EPQ59596.1 hypothetical protein GLOTRDRAFT_125893 [Gloeophyllum trabeum ATCC 11539]
MAEDEDDYLSDKFLADLNAASSSEPKTYSARRKEAEKKAKLKQEQNRIKSRRQLELESREAGLSKSLFERAKEEEATVGKGNKALAMMMKMGFKPGQSLGQVHDEPAPEAASVTPERAVSSTPEVEVKESSAEPSRDGTPFESMTRGLGSGIKHRTEPLPLNEWAGKKGIGSLKRGPSPSSLERMAKMAKTTEAVDQDTFRSRAREDYLERRAEGRLAPAQATCVSLDEKAGKAFNVLWLNPNNPDAFPEELMNALPEEPVVAKTRRRQEQETIEARLRKQMKADALQPLSPEDDSPSKVAERDQAQLTPEQLEEAVKFLSQSAQQRLAAVLSYLRSEYSYCFWCGCQYNDAEDLQQNCPGENEEDHD